MKKVEIKNLKKLQLWSMVKFIQCVDEYNNEIVNIDSEDSMFLNEFEWYTFRRQDDGILAVYTNERPCPSYSHIKVYTLLKNDKVNQKLIFSDVSFQITHSQQSEPIISCISGEELFLEISDLAGAIENELHIEGLRTPPMSEYRIIDKEKEREQQIGVINGIVDAYTSGAKSHPLFNIRLWGDLFSDNDNLQERYKEYLIKAISYNWKFYKEGIDSDNFEDGCYFINEVVKVIGDEDDYAKWCSENNYETNELYKCFLIIYKDILYGILDIEE